MTAPPSASTCRSATPTAPRCSGGSWVSRAPRTSRARCASHASSAPARDASVLPATRAAGTLPATAVRQQLDELLEHRQRVPQRVALALVELLDVFAQRARPL